MASGTAPEIEAIEDALNTLEQEATSVAAGLTEDQGTWRERPDSWSVSECLDHLATANEVTVRAMEPPAAQALEQGRQRRRPALPGFVGGWFVRALEPPVKPAFRGKAPQLIRPRQSPPLADALRRFLESRSSRARSCATMPASTLPACAFQIPSYAASASALLPASTSSWRTSGGTSGRRGACARPSQRLTSSSEFLEQPRELLHARGLYARKERHPVFVPRVGIDAVRGQQRRHLLHPRRFRIQVKHKPAAIIVFGLSSSGSAPRSAVTRCTPPARPEF